MSHTRKAAIQPTRSEDYPKWYQQVIKAADLAEHSPVRGCMIIKPWGYAIWENMQQILDKRFKETGHQNAYFPLFIPLSYLQKEAKHIEGFAKECAVVTHHRLVKNQEGILTPDGKLEEPLIVRPTSEMIIAQMFAKWIKSYRDLPLLINQWANVVRWEMRTRLFLRTAEFLWQEGHTAHATQEEALEEVLKMLDIYVDFTTRCLGIPVITGEKTARERFPGAINTLTFEMMMQDGKALQGGTSHFLGQKFAQAADITFCDAQGKMKHPWTTSWGITTRMIGGMIMVHGDDDGLVLPPRITPLHVVILPIVHQSDTKNTLLTYCRSLKGRLSELIYHDDALKVAVDERDMRIGDKIWSWVKKGVPIRIEVGMREITDQKLSIAKRTKPVREIERRTESDLIRTLLTELDDMQNDLLKKATTFRDTHLVKIDTEKEFYSFFKSDKGFAFAHWSGDPSIEEKVGRELSVSIRCIPKTLEKKEGVCPFSGGKSAQRVIFAKSY